MTSFTINQGTSGTLTLNPVSSNNGISVATNAGAVTIGAPVVAQASQTWEVVGGGANGSSLTVGGNVTFTGNVNKTGAGDLTLSGTNTGSGAVNLIAGTLNINSATALGNGNFAIETGTTFTNGTAGALVLTANNTQSWNGSYTFGGTQNLDLGTGAVTMGNSLTATVSNTLTVGGAIDDGTSTFALTKAGAGILVLNGANSYDGLTNLTAGTLTLAGANSNAAGGVTMAASTTLNINNADALGSGTFTIGGGTINNSSGAAITNAGNNAQNWNASFTFTGSNDLNLGTGAVALNATPTVTTTAGVLTVGGAITGAFGLTKNGAGTLTLNGLSTTAANNYDGTTTLDGGTVIIGADTAFIGALSFGSSNASVNTSTLNLSAASATYAGAMVVQTNTATANTITIGNGETLTNNAGVTIGGNATTGVLATSLTVSGTGTAAWNVNASGGTFRVGNSGNSNYATTLDMSGLPTFTANLGATGNFRVGTADTNAVVETNLVRLANTSTITAALFELGAVTGHTGLQTVRMGGGVTTINANTLSIGSTGSRGSGLLNFNDSGGSVIVRAADGVSRAVLNVVNTTGGTNTAMTGDVILAGHSADLFLSTVTIGARNTTATATTSSPTGTVTFDTGTFDATTVVLSSRAGSSLTTGNITGNLTLGGGTSTVGTLTMSQNTVSTVDSSGTAISQLTLNGSGANTITTLTMGNVALTGATATGGSQATLAHGGTATTTIDNLTMAANATTAAVGTTTTAVSTINVTGGTLNITNNLVMAATTLNANNQASGAISITGGTLTVGGNIQYTNGVGLETNSVTLNGGTLDMTAGNIGGAGALVTFNAQSGTLQNLAQLNNGGTLTKSTAGTLILEGTNTYSGVTNISAGTLQVGSGSITGTLGTGSVTNDATLTINRSDAYTVSNTISGTGQFIQAGAGVTTLSGTNTHTGKTTITGGTLAISSQANLGTTPVSFAADQLTLNGGTLRSTATLSLDANRGVTVSSASTIETNASTTLTFNSVIIGGSDLTKTGDGTLIFTAANTNSGTVTVSAGTLGGTGSTGGSVIVQSNGSLAPGASAGQFTVGGNLTVSGTVLMELGGYTTNDAAAVLNEMTLNGNLTNLAVLIAYENANSSLHDHLTTQGGSAPVFNTGSVFRISSSFLNGYVPSYGDIFDLMDWTTAAPVSGTPTFDLPTLSGGLAFNTDLFATNGLIVVVPEPSRAVLMLLGLLGLLMRRRRGR